LEADGKTLFVTAGTCGGGPAAAVTEYDDRVEIEVESTVQLGGGPRALCLDGVRIELDAPLGDRALVNASGLPIRVVKQPG